MTLLALPAPPLPIRAFTDVLLGVAGPAIEVPRPPGASLADIIALVPGVSERLRPHLRAKLEGELIDPERFPYHRIRPKGDCLVTVLVPLEAKNGLLGTLAVVALAGASIFVGGSGLPFLGSAFAAGSVGANVVAGGLSLAASLLLQGLQAPQQGDQAGQRTIGVATAQNSFEPGAPLQRVAGTRRVTPQLVMPPFSQVDGDDQIVTAAYGLSGPHQIADIRNAGASIDGAADIEYEVRQGLPGDAPLTLVTDTRYEVPLNLRLSQFRMKAASSDTNVIDTTISPYVPVWHRVETKIGPDRAKQFLTFDGGLVYGADSGPLAAITAIRSRIRKKGTTSWYNLPELLVRGQKQSGALRIFLDFNWLAPADMPGSVTAFTANYGGWSWKYHTVQDNTLATTYWAADPYFATNKIDWANQQQVKVYLSTDIFAQDAAYEIEVMRGYTTITASFATTSATVHTVTANSLTSYDFFSTQVDAGQTKVPNAQTRAVDQLTVSAIQSIRNEYPFDTTDQPTAFIVIRARNRSLDQVTCLASGLVPEWNGTSWVDDQVTSNPASWYRSALAGPENAEPVPLSLIDPLEDWHTWCRKKGWEVNAILKGHSLDQVLSIFAQSGMARPRNGATYGVIIDRPRPPKGRLANLRNISGYSFQKPLTRLPHALRVNLADEDQDFSVREVIVYAAGYNADGSGGLTEASRFESVTYEGITSEAQARFRAGRDLAWLYNRAMLHNFSQDIEHLEHQLGDLVHLQVDALGKRGGQGRVLEVLQSAGNVTGLVLDEEWDFTKADADGLDRGVEITLMDGDTGTFKVTGSPPDRQTVIFTTPFPMPTSGGNDLIVPGCLVNTGAYQQVSREVILWDMAPGRDLTCQFTAVDYAADAIYGGKDFNNDFNFDFR